MPFHDWEKTPNFDPAKISVNSPRWVNYKGSLLFISSVIAGEAFADASLLAFRDSSSFRAGELHRHIDQWDKLFQSSDHNLSEVLDWIHNFIHVDKFFTDYKGSHKGVNYNCERPPAPIFANHPSCKAFAQFISDTLIERLASGAISKGKVGECPPPRLVMPLTVEPTKPRLCNDDRFLNLWTQNRPFKLDSVQHLPKYVLPGFFQIVCDDKSGYDHIQLSVDSRTFFGFEWGGWFFVSCCIPFGWKPSAYIYHSTGLLASHYLRSLGIPSSLYIDDRHSSQLSFPNGCLPVAYQNLPSQDSINLALANAAIFLTCFILSSLGYFIGLYKSTLVPCKQVPYLGFISDSEKQAFILLPHKKKKFLTLLKQALSSESIDLVTLQRLGEKCISMVLAVPGARLYTNEINLALSRAVRSSRPVKLSGPLRQELEHWLFLETWNGFLPWRSEKHCHFRLFSDSSSFAWGGVLSPGAITVSTSDHWDSSVIGADIATKETLALNNALQSFGNTVRNSWVDAFVDSQVLLHSCNRRGSRSHSLVTALKCLFQTTMHLNVDLHVYYVPGPENPADSPSRRLSFQDSRLSPKTWDLVQILYGGPKGHSVDLMARASNVQTDLSGKPLPFFSESPLVNALGVNVFAQSPNLYRPEIFSNPCVFPPICLIPKVFKYLNSLKLPYTLVVPDVIPRRFWWPLLLSACSSSSLLASKGASGVLLTPSRDGILGDRPIPWDLWVFRISNN